MSLKKLVLLPLAGLCSVSGTSPPVWGQEAGLEEVIVTARKREESLQLAPMSISAFSGAELESRSVQTVADIDDFTPNLIFNSTAPISANSATAAIFIRGIGQNDYQMSADPGVGLYLDGVYISRAIGGVLDAVEIERVEVLRGPQGTLFGRNTIGGAIHIVTRKPDESFAGNISMELGTDQLVETSGHLNVPIADGLYTSAAVNYRSRDDYVENLAGGPDLGGEDRLSGRFSLLFEPREDLSFQFVIDGTRIREESAPFVMVQNLETGFVPSVWNALFSDNPSVCADPTNPARLDDSSCSSPRWALGEGKSAATFRTSDPDSLFNNLSDAGRPYESAGDIDVYGFGGTLEWAISDQYSIKSISSYRDVEGFWARDGDHSPLDMIATINDWDQSQVTQEFQVLGSNFEDRLRWVLGLYYSEEEGIHNDWGMIWSSNILFKSGANIDASSLAGFGQAIVDLTDRLALTVGARWTRDQKTFNGDQFIIVDNVFGFPPGTPLIPADSKTIEDRAWTPAISLSYQLTDEFNIYGSYSEGFKGGGFTQRIFPPIPQIPTFAPEKASAYELGIKYEGLDDRLRINSAGFYTDYSDLQLLGQEPILNFAPVIFNAAEATITGFELELTAAPYEVMLVHAGLGYLNAEYDHVDAFAQAVGVDTTKEFVNAPELNTSLGISYDIHTVNLGTFTSRVDSIYRSKVYNDVTNAEVVAQGAYHVVNLTFGWEHVDSLWSAKLALLNVSDERYKDSGNYDLGGGVAEAVFVRGREIRFSIRHDF